MCNYTKDLRAAFIDVRREAPRPVAHRKFVGEDCTPANLFNRCSLQDNLLESYIASSAGDHLRQSTA
jgi:hypothetical protein